MAVFEYEDSREEEKQYSCSGRTASPINPAGSVFVLRFSILFSNRVTVSGAHSIDSQSILGRGEIPGGMPEQGLKNRKIRKRGTCIDASYWAIGP